MRTDVPVVLDGLTKRFHRTTALDAVSLEIEPGEVFGYLGPNGAGKTTTMRMLVGMLRPSAGSARVYGLDTWRQAVAVHRAVGYVPGEPALYPRLTGLEHIDYLSHLRGRADRPMARAVAERLGLDLTRRSRTLSRGNRQKLAIVLALMSAPRLLILDEPTSGLDPLVQREFHALLREHTQGGGAVLLSSHILGDVQRVADRIGVVREGRLVAVERLADLSGKSLHHVRASFADGVRAEDFGGIPGVRDLELRGSILTCSAPQSALDVLLKRVSGHAVLDFECAEAELDEMFLAYYSGDGHADQRAAQDAA
ncbi:ABC transporter [Sinomonas atrocyanea]|uniref:ABC transporter n=1 Tax=Sinomonas atrocyanea TaxID=37927 RepID=A0A127A537_9MICC|nr:ABC transporter ATP-binding protein [Sinomonas atrocyanea]AMM34206.1 ABC transporter [Sinomonas atrocyanea]GEB64849.1 ABC transporter ATP-binding protein [Sinomonas atrocyanea]GGG75286.1 ABC transporter ATP-binding protein [Sinomonas atrocyanea]